MFTSVTICTITCVNIESVFTGASIFTRHSNAVINVVFTCVSIVAIYTLTCVGINPILTSSTVLACDSNTIINVVFTVVSIVAIYTLTCVGINSILTSSTVLACDINTVIYIVFTVVAIVPICTLTGIWSSVVCAVSIMCTGVRSANVWNQNGNLSNSFSKSKLQFNCPFVAQSRKQWCKITVLFQKSTGKKLGSKGEASHLCVVSNHIGSVLWQMLCTANEPHTFHLLRFLSLDIWAVKMQLIWNKCDSVNVLPQLQ